MYEQFCQKKKQKTKWMPRITRLWGQPKAVHDYPDLMQIYYFAALAKVKMPWTEHIITNNRFDWKTMHVLISIVVVQFSTFRTNKRFFNYHHNYLSMERKKHKTFNYWPDTRSDWKVVKNNGYHCILRYAIVKGLTPDGTVKSFVWFLHKFVWLIDHRDLCDEFHTNFKTISCGKLIWKFCSTVYLNYTFRKKKQ